MTQCGEGDLCGACSQPIYLLTQEPGCGAPIVKPALHFVGFRGDEYTRAVRIWGKPSFIHRVNDPRMRRELHPSDTIIFANGYEAKPADRNGQDLNEEGYL